jgi:hypothetical protein
MDRLPQPAARAKALIRAFDLGAVYPEGASVGEDDRFYAQAVAVLLEAMELARELRGKDTGRLFLGNARLAVGQAIGRHTAEEEVAGIFLLDDLNCLLAEEVFDPCLPRSYRRKGRLSVEAAAATVFREAEKHGATGAILFHLRRCGDPPWGESHKLVRRLQQEAEPRNVRLLDYLLISPPHFESLRSWPSWEKP